MNNTVALTGVQVDIATYFARVITFDFLENGISLSFFRKPKNLCVTD
ncbi:RAxF-45 family protein [Sporosarcina aquimarina]|uniref:RAxF-45 family protein n=1 Tax=Sporosarcina aquimarina TaxID=114975 RepID=A0ABU4FXK2_9BACL|nr:RAxF-45 family protein [Sporosarcina aquimarina]MDW0109441.1 RAxF-45 family protein [Sporosarcina aquimarina]